MGKILVLDDERTVAKAMCAYLERAFPGVETVCHHSPWNALGYLLSEEGADVSLCIVDLGMPGMSGAALVRRALANRPELRGKFLVCSGDPFGAQDPALKELGCMYLNKPHELKELRAIVAGALGG